LKIYKYIYNKKSKSQRLNPSQGKIKISPYSRFPIKEKRQNAEQVKILILACEGLTKRSAVDCPERETSVVAVAKTHLPERGFSSVKPGKFYARSGGLHRLLSYFLIVLNLTYPSNPYHN
jgi:hypothetical protein